MARFAVALFLSVLPSLALAQLGPGRFPCTQVNGDGSLSPDQSLCANTHIIAPGSNDPNADSQGDRPNPVNSVCVLSPESGAYFCGGPGATCSSDFNCDNGACVNGVCQVPVLQRTRRSCYGIKHLRRSWLILPVGQTAAIFDQFCSSGYCNSGTGACDVHSGVGEECRSDINFKCAEGLECNLNTALCIDPAAPPPVQPPPPTLPPTKPDPAEPENAGAGRFPCTVVNSDGSFSPDQSLCANSHLFAPGSNDPNASLQGDRPNPVDSMCVLSSESGTYFCGGPGAACTSDSNCDNGVCADGVCQGTFGQACAGDDRQCSGFRYCTGPDGLATASNTCGGLGSFCQDPNALRPNLRVGQIAAINNQFCASGYCNWGTGLCDVHSVVGEECRSDINFKCAEGLECDLNTALCINPAAPPPVQTTPSPPTTTTTTTLAPTTTTTEVALPAPTTADGAIGCASLDATIYGAGIVAWAVPFPATGAEAGAWTPDSCNAACATYKPRYGKGEQIGCGLFGESCYTLLSDASPPVSLRSLALEDNSRCNYECPGQLGRKTGCGGLDTNWRPLFTIYDLGYSAPAPATTTTTTTTTISTTTTTIAPTTTTTEVALPAPTTADGAIGCASLDATIYGAGIVAWAVPFPATGAEAGAWTPDSCNAACATYTPRYGRGTQIGCGLFGESCYTLLSDASPPVSLRSLTLEDNSRCNYECPGQPGRKTGCGGLDTNWRPLFTIYDLGYSAPAPATTTTTSSEGTTSSSSITTSGSSTTTDAPPPATTTAAPPSDADYVGCMSVLKNMIPAGVSADVLEGQPADGWVPETCRAVCAKAVSNNPYGEVYIGCGLSAVSGSCVGLRGQPTVDVFTISTRPEQLCQSSCAGDSSRLTGCGGRDEDGGSLWSVWALSGSGGSSSSTTSSSATTITSAPTASSTPFRVSGAVSTTKVIEAPVTVSCGSSQVYNNCVGGAERAQGCCRSDLAVCQAIYEANRLNCDEIGLSSYPCISTATPDMEDCCATIFSAFFGAGGGEEACAV
ncbi:hypothetical protein JCM11251_003746 [Rhodosporidiobolus azoricus]